MISEDLLLEYAWIIREFQNSEGMTFKEMNEKWMADKVFSKGAGMSYATFHRHLDYLSTSLGVIIEYDHRRRVYHMVNKEPLRGEEMIELMFQIMVVNDSIRDLKGLEHRVALQRFSLGESVFKDVVKALKKNRIIEMSYLPQKKDELKAHTVMPYGLKMYDSRTYMIGMTKYGILPFELDRIKQLEVTSKVFVMPDDFNIHEYYFDYYGVYRDENIPAVEVVLRAYENENRYLNELPLHHSQEEIGQGGNGYHDYKLFVSPSEDFIGKLISRQDRLVVISPQWLADKMEERIEKMLNNYHLRKKI